MFRNIQKLNSLVPSLPRSSRGATLVEAALVIPVFLFVVFAVICVALMLGVQGTLDHAASHALSLATTSPELESTSAVDCSKNQDEPFCKGLEKVRAVGKQIATSALIGEDKDHARVAFLNPPSETTDNVEIVWPKSSNLTYTQAIQQIPVVVKVHAKFQLPVPGLNLSYTLYGSAAGFRETGAHVAYPNPTDCYGNPVGSAAYNKQPCICQDKEFWDGAAMKCVSCPGVTKFQDPNQQINPKLATYNENTNRYTYNGAYYTAMPGQPCLCKSECSDPDRTLVWSGSPTEICTCGCARGLKESTDGTCQCPEFKAENFTKTSNANGSFTPTGTSREKVNGNDSCNCTGTVKINGEPERTNTKLTEADCDKLYPGKDVKVNSNGCGCMFDNSKNSYCHSSGDVVGTILHDWQSPDFGGNGCTCWDTKTNCNANNGCIATNANDKQALGTGTYGPADPFWQWNATDPSNPMGSGSCGCGGTGCPDGAVRDPSNGCVCKCTGNFNLAETTDDNGNKVYICEANVTAGTGGTPAT